MNGPVRLFESSTNAEARELLRAGIAEQPRPAALQRTALALGVGGGVAVTSTATASAASLAAAPSVLLVVAKWVGVGTVLGVALAGGANGLSNLAPPAKSSASAVTRLAAAASAVATTSPAVTPRVEVAVGSSPEPVASTTRSLAPPPKPSLSQTTPTVASAASLAEEVAEIDAVRRALAARDTTGALRSLDEYARKARTGTLDLEAQLLRIDALEQRGQHQAARELALGYLARHPSDPHSARLRALFGEP